MKVSVDIDIDKPKELVWHAISNIENCADMISSIIGVDILERPKDSLIGLKWKEKRVMLGKEASETMWITDAVDNEYYCTRAESHGSVYITKLSLKELGDKTQLTMSFWGQPQTTLTKFLLMFLSVFIKGSMKKALQSDLDDIKHYVEKEESAL